MIELVRVEQGYRGLTSRQSLQRCPALAGRLRSVLPRAATRTKPRSPTCAEEPNLPRWTIRGVCPDAIGAVQALQSETGAALGDIVSLRIAAGLNEARCQFEEQFREHGCLPLLTGRALGTAATFLPACRVWSSALRPPQRAVCAPWYRRELSLQSSSALPSWAPCVASPTQCRQRMHASFAHFLKANRPIMALRRWPPLDTSMAPTPAGCTRHSARATSTTWTNGYDREHRDLASSWAVYSPAHPAGVALPDKERCPPKAEVVSSNLAGFANIFNDLRDLARDRFPGQVAHR